MKTFMACVLLVVIPLTVLAEGILVGEEFIICDEGPGKNARGTVDIARGKDMYLAVWREGWHGKGGNARIFAARISAEGKVLEPEQPTAEAVLAFVREQQPDLFTYDDWLALNEIEEARGAEQGRPRVKFTSVAEMKAALGR